MQHLMRAVLIHLPSPELLLNHSAHASSLEFSCKVLHVTRRFLVLVQLSWGKVPVQFFLYSASNSSLEDWAVSWFLTPLQCHILAFISSVFLLFSHDARETQVSVVFLSGNYLTPKAQGQTDSYDGTALSQWKAPKQHVLCSENGEVLYKVKW